MHTLTHARAHMYTPKCLEVRGQLCVLRIELKLLAHTANGLQLSGQPPRISILNEKGMDESQWQTQNLWASSYMHFSFSCPSPPHP